MSDCVKNGTQLASQIWQLQNKKLTGLNGTRLELDHENWPLYDPLQLSFERAVEKLWPIIRWLMIREAKRIYYMRHEHELNLMRLDPLATPNKVSKGV